ncbi:MAG: pyruvate ferredoxin oxidoreductase [Bacteroidaceae bacterium]|nr:pyruvate ferredoxin oxidoreductase [Bacteroidaceae bacterium]
MMLDYKYIEQLLDAYFEGQTTLEEEKILRAFFRQHDLPENLVQYRELFIYEQLETEEDRLGNEFDKKMMAMIAEETPAGKTSRIVRLHKTVAVALRPFFHAAAVVAVMVTIGTASQALFKDSHRDKQQTGVATMQPVTGKNVADVKATADSLIIDTLKVLND